MRGVNLRHQLAAIVIGSMMVLHVLVPTGAHAETHTTSILEQTDVTTLFAETLELPNLIRIAVGRNPKVKAAKARWQATIEQYPASDSITRSNVHVTVTSCEAWKHGSDLKTIGSVFHKCFHIPAPLIQLARSSKKQLRLKA